LTKTSPWPHSKILTSFLDEIVYLAWLLLHIFKEQMPSVDYTKEDLSLHFIFFLGRQRYEILSSFPNKSEIFFPAFPLIILPLFRMSELYLFISPTNFSLKAGANV